jgi:hypothetical protein
MHLTDIQCFKNLSIFCRLSGIYGLKTPNFDLIQGMFKCLKDQSCFTTHKFYLQPY